MALRILLSNRLIIPQRISLTRFCRCYTPLSFEYRSTISSLPISNSSLYCHQFRSKSAQLLSPHQTYLLSYKFASSSSSSSSDNKPPSSSDDNSSSSSPPPSSNDGKGSSNNNNNDNEDGGNENPDSKVSIVLQPGNPLMPMEVPENYPIVPLIPVSRHPLFPKFIKMLEITNKDLMDLIRRKVRLNQPYAGIFLRKEPEKPPTEEVKTSTSETTKDKEKVSATVTSDVIKNLDEVYNIGAFVQIHEVHDMGDRLRMIVMAHRRIKIVGLVSDEIGIKEVDRRPPQPKTNGSRRRQRRKGRINIKINNITYYDFYR